MPRLSRCRLPSTIQTICIPVMDKVFPRTTTRPASLPRPQHRFGMRSTTRNCLLAAANILIPVAVLTFATGFFPYKPFVPGLGQYDLSHYGDPPESHFDKVIFMVVDALRSDFVYSASSGFKFTQRLVDPILPTSIYCLHAQTSTQYNCDPGYDVLHRERTYHLADAQEP